ncbi:MAG TPA: hypothetical protein VFE78_31880 [Gemmataceae bacterium]|nr:hypothetical protein [Gemmataceae bacterium]
MLRSRLTFAAALALAAFFVPQARAGKVKVWHQHTPAQYDKAKFQHAVVSSEGALRLSRRLKPLVALDATHVWDVAEDRDGNLFVATGGEGKVYKVSAAGKVSVAYAGEGGQALCLAVAPDGGVYAGTGPAGQIIRIDPRGEAKVFCETGESYVWSLALDPKSGALFAGTGPHGRVCKVTPDGKASVFYATRQEHVLAVAAGADGTLYAGTDKGGLVFRIDPRGKGFVLFQAAQAEVRALKVTPEAVYAGTSASSRSRGRGGVASRGGQPLAAAESEGDSIPAAALSLKKEKSAAATKASKTEAAEDKAGGKSSAAPAPTAPAGGENSVYRIGLDGSVREVFREKTLVLSLLRQAGHFFVGTGMEGQLFEVNEATRERTEIARLDHGQVLCLCRRRDGSVVVGTGDPGKLYVLQDSFVSGGTVTSDVLDAKLVSRWGALRWLADTPEGTKVTVAVRSGNVSEPDETWSDWSAEQTDGEQAVTAAPPARYLQYRLTLNSDNPAVSPAVRSVSLRYATANQAPEITKVEVPDLNAVNLDNPKKLKFKWAATDANEDELTYSVFVRKEGWKEWVLLEEDFEKTDYEWDTTTTPSGLYRLKVVASDRKDNAEKDALSAERVSAPFVVSHSPPAVNVKATAASFAVNGKKWVNVFPSDGLFDSKSETFRFRTEPLKPGTYVLVLRVRDAAGNTGSGDVVFTVPLKK